VRIPTARDHTCVVDEDMTNKFADVADDFDIDPSTESYAKQSTSPDAGLKARLQQTTAPLHVLANKGVIDMEELGMRGVLDDHEDAVEWPSIVRIDDADDPRGYQAVHLHQRIRERSEDSFGSFGAVAEDTETVEWTVVRLTDESVIMRNQPDWRKKREVPRGEFLAEYEPLTITICDGDPQAEPVEPREIPKLSY